MDRERIIRIAREPDEVNAMRQLAERVVIVTRRVWTEHNDNRTTQAVLPGSRQPVTGRIGAWGKTNLAASEPGRRNSGTIGSKS